MTEKDHDLLLRIDTKVDGINARLDTLNGSVLRHEGEIRRNELAIALTSTRQEERTRPGWMPNSKKAWFTGGTLLLALMTLAATFAAKLLELGL